MTEQRTPEQVKADEEYFEALLEMFTTQGWKNLVKEMVSNYGQVNQVSTLGETPVQYALGQLNILENLINLENTVKLTMEQNEAESNEDN